MSQIVNAEQVKQTARSMARETLALSPSFRNMPSSEQRSVYMNLVNENIGKLNKTNQVARAMANGTNNGPGANMGFGGYDPGFEGSVDAFEDLVDSVDFPEFVKDLMSAVFNANLKVMKEQTDTYIKLLKESTKPVADFVKQINEDDSLSYLAETQGDKFNMSMETAADGSTKMSLTTPEGEPVDMEDNEVKAKIMEAKIAMAKEHRAALREVLLMGVTRLVVEKGEIEAGVEFKITANRRSVKNSERRNTNVNVNNVQGSYSSPLGGLFGGPSGSFSNTNTNTNIRVDTSNKTASDELSASLKGKVNIKFKTDYFKLDNFAQMYADGGVGALKPNDSNGGGALPTQGR